MPNCYSTKRSDYVEAGIIAIGVICLHRGYFEGYFTPYKVLVELAVKVQCDKNHYFSKRY